MSHAVDEISFTFDRLGENVSNDCPIERWQIRRCTVFRTGRPRFLVLFEDRLYKEGFDWNTLEIRYLAKENRVSLLRYVIAFWSGIV